MSDNELIRFYQADSPICVGGTAQPLAACWEIEPDLADMEMPCEIGAEVFELDPSFRAQLPEAIATGLTSNNFVVRLNALQLRGDHWHAELQLANYFDAARSNFAMDLDTADAVSLRQLVHGRTQSVGPLADSPLTNHLGVVGMVRTLDHKWVIPQRSGKVFNRKLTSSASVSGAVSAGDLEHSDLHAILQRALRRECHEELGIPLSDCHLIGVLREFRRGGKPEAYFVARTPLSFEAVAKRQLEAADVDETSMICDHAKAPPNFTLRAGLALAEAWLA